MVWRTFHTTLTTKVFIFVLLNSSGGYSVVGSGDRRGSQDGVAGKVSAALVGSGEKKSNGHGGKELSEYDESENTDRSASTGTAASSSPGRQSRASARKGKGARGRWRRKKTKAEPETLGNRELKAVEKKAEPETLGNRVLRAVEKRRLAPRIIVIGDVHGCLDELKELVKKVAYWPGDLLLFLGDLVSVVNYGREWSSPFRRIFRIVNDWLLYVPTLFLSVHVSYIYYICVCCIDRVLDGFAPRATIAEIFC